MKFWAVVVWFMFYVAAAAVAVVNSHQWAGNLGRFPIVSGPTAFLRSSELKS